MRNLTCEIALTAMSLVGLASLSANSSPESDADLVVLPERVECPEDNPTTKAKVELGKQLFFDPRLSGDNSMSCAKCHLPDKAFADGLPGSLGFNGKPLTRNTPTLLNVGLYSTLLWDGRADSLEEQALGPIQSPEEMNQSLDELVVELNAIPGYVRQFEEVFGRPVNAEDLAKALAAFQRTLLARNSAFDRYLSGDKPALSDLARQGLELFRGDAGCVRCHHGPLLSDGLYYRLGIGGRRDLGRGAITQKREDLFRFRTPSLRNVAETGPYMHDGSKATLYDVVEFYYRSLPSQGPDGLELDIEPLVGRSYSEIDAIVVFLKSLSGTPVQVEPPQLP
ncbi:MAG: cytochrome-c peroxidase [bacterium]|nr:cytochrome-c peroxidase [bacterium]